MIFVDTSAIIPFVNVEDKNHLRAKVLWAKLAPSKTVLVSNSYVLLECTALVQKRFGLDILSGLENTVFPLIEIEWIAEKEHIYAMQLLHKQNRRHLSLVDVSAFATMRRMGVNQIFTFDQHFAEEGFEVLP